jgi:mannose-6-phosphate isomerase-like protein (cupin superfamily)
MNLLITPFTKVEATQDSGPLKVDTIVVKAGGHSRLHSHPKTTEIYIVQSGEGVLTLGEEKRRIRPGDIIEIPAGTPHKIEHSGQDLFELKIVSVKNSLNSADVVNHDGSSD